VDKNIPFIPVPCQGGTIGRVHRSVRRYRAPFAHATPSSGRAGQAAPAPWRCGRAGRHLPGPRDEMTNLPRKRLGNAVIKGVQARYHGQAPLNFDPVAQLLKGE
jgi:hypothetical protein